MIKSRGMENRRYKRHHTLDRPEYNFSYDVETPVECEIDGGQKTPAHLKFPACSKNLSVEGICLVSDKKLKKGTPVHLSLFLPETNETVAMEGEVKWSAERIETPEGDLKENSKKMFDTGIKLKEVNGDPVPQTIHYDKLFKLQWSNVLESVFGRYRLIMDERRKES